MLIVATPTMRFFVVKLALLSVALAIVTPTAVSAYYYNEDGEVEADYAADASSGRARALYTRSVKSPPSAPPSRLKAYTPPSPSRARISGGSKGGGGYEPQQFEQQSYEQQSAVPNIQHDVVGRPEPYNFNYDVKDEYGNNQFRREDSDDTGAVRGSYGYTDANGLYRIVDYVADADGFRASIRTNEPGLVEPSPVTGEVQAPASVTLQAEATPAGVREQQLRYQSQSQSAGSGGFQSGGGGGSYGGGHQSSSGFSSSGSAGSTGSLGSSSYSGGGGGGGGGISIGSPAERIQQQRLSGSLRSGTKY